MNETIYFVAIPFIARANKLAAGQAVECASAAEAVSRAEAMARYPEFAGAVAFQRFAAESASPQQAAVVLGQFGQTPDNIDRLLAGLYF